MAKVPLEKLKEVYDYYNVNGIDSSVQKFQVSEGTIYSYVRKYREYLKTDKYEPQKHKSSRKQGGQPGETWDEKGDEATWNYNGDANITNLDEALIFSKVNLDIWEVKRHIFNTWTTTYKDNNGIAHQKWNVQVKVWFQRKVEEIKLRNIRDEILKEMAKRSPVYRIKKYPKIDGETCVGEFDPFDVHFNRYVEAWMSEEDVNIQTTREDFEKCVIETCKHFKMFNIREIVIPLPQDFFNSDNPRHTTTRGTSIRSHVSYERAYKEGYMLIIWAIDMFREIAPVKVFITRGNHDGFTSFHLGELLSVWYRKCKEVAIDNEPKPRKYYLAGITLLVFTHGREEKFARLINIISKECPPQMWLKAIFHEIHVGDKHHQEVKEYEGTRLRIMPSISGRSDWDYQKAFKSWRAAESFVWGDKTGYKANFSVNLIDKRK